MKFALPIVAAGSAWAAGSGTVDVPAGKYTTGPIELVSNLVLSFDAGAVVHFPRRQIGRGGSRQPHHASRRPRAS
jgi:polygalacturonase